MIKFFQTNTVPGHEGRSTWLELFFDLVYVAILVELGSRLSHDLTLIGTFEFLALFVMIWWTWLGLVFYTRYFPSDDIGQRLLTVLYMGIMILLAFEIHGVFGETLTTFVLTYAATKFVLALMYFRAWRQYPEYRTMTAHYAVMYALLGLAWIGISIFATRNFWLWGVLVLIDILLPILIRGSHRFLNWAEFKHPEIKHHYMVHRFGELTIIVLGEFFIKLISTSSGIEITAFQVYLGVCLLLISVCFWWLYFDHTDRVHLAAGHSRPAPWIYTHYFLLSAIAIYGVVGTKVFESPPGEILGPEKRLMLCGALAIAVLALGVIDWASPEGPGNMNRKPHLSVRVVAAVVLLLLAVLGATLPVELFIPLVMLVLVVQVGIDIGVRLRNREGALPVA